MTGQIIPITPSYSPKPATQAGQPETASNRWIHSPALDTVGILLPPVLISLWVLITPSLRTASVSPWVWLVVVVGVDVAHVYSSLYRTYLNPMAWQQWRRLMIGVPLLATSAGIAVYQLTGALGFWRVLAYLAVFHFIRQQYGFMARYDRQGVHWIDAAALYSVMLYPLIYWHTHLPRAFSWFLPQDFIPDVPRWAEPVAWGVMAMALLGYGIKTLWDMRQRRESNWPKHMVLLGTWLVWHTGIVWTNSDLAFTLTNVLGHGIPYMVLVWAVQNQHNSAPVNGTTFVFSQRLSVLGKLLLWLALPITLAWLEEGLWDGLLWREHTQWFSGFTHLPVINNVAWLVVPVLAVPQITHYILDGTIWRKKFF